ncbi:MAG TPA: rubrerythrin family protein [Terriglobales bacterium]|nr:rubrerythrin family protein [Terriglobales bacterium]
MLLELLSFLIPSAVAVKHASDTTSTLDNLQDAFQGESNASHRYSVFAKQADAEGYGQVASLFRAASKAEEFHARNHADVITKLGGKAHAKLDTPVVKTTRENLMAARDGEVYERDQMYPPFIEQAKKERQPEVIRTFTYALKTEAEHARLFSDALDNLEQMRTKTTYYVCNVCGYTVQTLNFLKCLVCGHSKADYIPVN